MSDGVEPLDWRCRPPEVAAAWPADRPLAMLLSARAQPRWARWSILASPSSTYRYEGRGRFADWLAAAAPRPRPGPSPTGIPFEGGWIGAFSYELGRILEPAAAAESLRFRDGDRLWPAAFLLECPAALVHDNQTGQWWAVGDRERGWLPPLSEAPASFTAAGPDFECGRLRSATTPDDYLAAVARALEWIAAGDVFQVNLSHRLSAPFAGSTRTLALRALAAGGAWYGAYLELPEGRAICSLSPELFLEADLATGAVVTRPIKGTRPARVAARELADSAKDAAELTMIVDLMRNDLGRLCEFGSVRVPVPRAIETHPTVHHGVAEVTGRLRPGVGLGELLGAAFPAGSVTGAPKIRAMQIIETLEPVPRGPYCGAIGYICRQGRVGLNVAIRTIALSGARPQVGAWDRLDGILDYGAGGGIVADSEPLAEYRETLDKAAVLEGVLQSAHPAPQV